VIDLSEAAINRKKICFQIQELLLKKSANFIQIVEICDVDRATVSMYLNELIEDGNIVLKPKRKQGIEKYALTTKGKNTITLLLEKQKIKTQIDQMSPKKFLEFKQLLGFLVKSKSGEEFLLRFQDTDHSEKIKKFKNLGTKSLSKE
jgi:predicted transcriptional regulator